MRRFFIFALLVGCGDSGRDLEAYRAAVANSRVKIGDMVTVAETSMADGRAVTAELRLDPVVYSYATLGAGAVHDVRIDTIDGHIVSSAQGGASGQACPDAISISAAIAIAEARIAGGAVIAAIPDDDVACAREIQVLAPDLLWEVKVAGDGTVLEVEESDENED